MLHEKKNIVSFKVIQYDKENINPPVLLAIVVVRMYTKQLICWNILTRTLLRSRESEQCSLALKVRALNAHAQNGQFFESYVG